MAASQTDTPAARAIEIFAELVTSGDANPYPLYAQLHELGDAATAEPGPVIAFSHAAVSEVLRDPAYRVVDAARLDETWPGWREHPSCLAYSLLLSNSPEHERMRALVAGTFTPSRVGQLLANLTLLLFAGFETTTHLLGNGLRLILTTPEVERSLRAGIMPAQAFVAELLRYDPPVHLGTDRWRPEAGDLCGVPIPAGSRVMALLGAANRDPRTFAEPDRFDPARPDGASLLSFGAGPHYCLGAALARLEATVAFPLLLDGFPWLASGGEPVRRSGVGLRGYDTLPVTVS